MNFVRRVPVKHGGVTNAHNTRCLNHPGRRAAIISQTHLSQSPERAYLQEAESSMVLLGNTSDVSVGNTRNIKILCGPPRQHHTQALKCLQKITCRVALFPALSLSVLQRDRLKLLRHQYRLCQFSTVSTNPGFNLLKFNVSGVFCFFFRFFFLISACLCPGSSSCCCWDVVTDKQAGQLQSSFSGPQRQTAGVDVTNVWEWVCDISDDTYITRSWDHKWWWSTRTK